MLVSAIGLVALIMAAGPVVAEVNGPGWISGTAQAVSPEAARAYYDSLSAAAPVTQMAAMDTPMAPMAAAPETLPEIVALARALQHDPKLIYEFVHNHIDYVPYYGYLKGPILTLLDRSGNDFDQAGLMIALLKASGHGAEFVYGTMTIPHAATNQRDVRHWLSVDNNWAVMDQILADGGIPHTSTTIDRVWVRAIVGGVTYLFDPAFKTYTETAGINLNTAMGGYSSVDLLAAAGGTTGSDYVQSLNETTLNAKLALYTSNLVSYLRTNHPNAATEEIVGGREIVQEFLQALPTSLPFPYVESYHWADSASIPSTYIHQVTIQHGGINATLNVPDVAGHKLAITYDTSGGAAAMQAMTTDMVSKPQPLGMTKSAASQSPTTATPIPSGTAIAMPAPVSANKTIEAPGLSEHVTALTSPAAKLAGQDAGSPAIPAPQAVNPTTDFGRILPTGSSTWSIVVTNDPQNTVNLIVTSQLLNNTSGAYQIVYGAGTRTLTPGQSVTVLVAFGGSGQARGTKTATLRLTRNYSGHGTYTDDYPFTGFVADTLHLSLSGYTGGQTFLNEPLNTTVSLNNNGVYPLTVRSTMTLTGTNPSMFTLLSGNGAGTVAAGGSRGINWRYLASSRGSHSAAINMALTYDGIVYSAGNMISLSGTTSLRPNTEGSGLQFGTRYLGNSSEGVATFKNNGTLALTINSITLTGTDSARFQLLSGTAGGSLAAGQSRDINTRYLANALGTHAATITINYTYDGVSGTYTLPLAGTTIAVPIAQLWLDDAIFAQEAAPATGSATEAMTITINHPYAADGGTYADQTSGDYKLKRGSSYVIISEFGGSTAGLLLEQRQRLLDELRAGGFTDTSREVLTESLNIMGQTWMKQSTLSDSLLAEIADVINIRHHRFGIMAQEGSYYVDVKTQFLSTISRHGSTADAGAAFRAIGFMESAMEHGVLEQLQGLDHPAVSTVRLMHIANMAGTNNKIFLANDTTWATVKPLLKNYSPDDLTNLTARFNATDSFTSMVLPEEGQIVSSQWHGKGYVEYSEFSNGDTGMGMIIGGDLSGGYAAMYGAITPSYLSYTSSFKLQTPVQTIQPSSFEPVNLATGAYLYDHEDLALGGAEPNGLHFTRTYDSDNRTTNSPLGYGWNHGYNISVNVHSNVELGLGQRTPVDAATLMVSAVATIDLMRTTGVPALKNWVTSCLTANWAMDQLAENARSIRLQDKVLTYIKLPDGTFNPPPGVTTALSYTNSLYKLTERFGTVINFNSDKKISTWTDVDGNMMSFTYDATASKKLISILDGTNRTLTLNYTNDYLTSVTDSASPARTVRYSQTNGNLTSFTDAESKVWSYGYDTSGHRLLTVRDPLGNVLATNTYDGLNDVATQIFPRQGGGTVTFNYYFSGFRNVEADPDNHQTVYFLDRQGRTNAVQDQLGNLQNTTFDGHNQVVKSVDPLGHATLFSYDGHNNLRFTTNALNMQTENVYDSLYHLTDTFDQLRHQTHYTYNATHHPTSTTDAMGNYFLTTWQNILPINSTDGRGTVTTYTYDSYGNPNTTKVAAHTLVDQNYDAIGRRISLADQAGAITGFGYNNLNLVTTITDPLSRATTLTYDNAGRLASRSDRNGAVIAYAYTPSGKTRLINYPTGTDVTFTFTSDWEKVATMTDALGDATTYGYDAANRLISQTDPNGFAVGYQYDAAGNLTRVTYPGAGRTVSYTFDALNRMQTARIDWLNQTATYTYDAAGRLYQLTNFNGTVTTYTYDNANRLTSLIHTGGGKTLAGMQFPSLDGNGNRVQEVRTEAQCPTDLAVESLVYTYNAQGDRLQAAGSDSFVYDNEGQPTSKGGVANTWDYEHRLTSVGGAAAQYFYDGVGNRLRATRSGVSTRYIYDKGGNLLAETNNAGAITRYYIHGQGMLAFVEGSTAYTYHHDAVGNTVAVTDGSGVVKNAYAYTSYGRVTNKTEAVAQPFQFAGQFGVMTETNGLLYMRARYYDPKIGRFLSEDPAGFDGGLNLYAYVGGNPVMGVDPTGLCEASWNSVFATREGMVGGTTATGHIIQESDVFVALPSRSALNKNVELNYNGNTVIAPVQDVGPWNTKDPYWLTNSRPQAESGTDLYGRKTNGAGIDLSNEAFRQLGLKNNATIKWRFSQ